MRGDRRLGRGLAGRDETVPGILGGGWGSMEPGEQINTKQDLANMLQRGASLSRAVLAE